MGRFAYPAPAIRRSGGFGPFGPDPAGTIPQSRGPGRYLGGRSEGNQMFDTQKVEIEWGGKTLSLETGRVARQADGAVLARLGDTVVLCAVTAAKSVKPGQDFFPLTVH